MFSKRSHVSSALLLASLVGAMTVVALPARAESASAVDCGAGEGRERFTTAGLSLDFEAPAITAPQGDFPPEGELTAHAARFPFVADLAPYETVTVRAVVSWEGPSDFDFFLVHEVGGYWDGDAQYNLTDGTQSEEFEADLTHCELFRLTVLSYTASPLEHLHIEVDVTRAGATLRCAADDPAPNCAGVPPSQPPDPPGPDPRLRLYLADGDMGDGRLVAQRPAAGTPRCATGLAATGATPGFTTRLAAPRDIDGLVYASLWVMSPTAAPGAALRVELLTDGAPAATVTVPGDRIDTDNPTAVLVALPVARRDVSEVSLQLRPEGGQAPNIVVCYGSVQHQSRVTLP